MSSLSEIKLKLDLKKRQLATAAAQQSSESSAVASSQPTAVIAAAAIPQLYGADVVSQPKLAVDESLKLAAGEPTTEPASNPPIIAVVPVPSKAVPVRAPAPVVAAVPAPPAMQEVPSDFVRPDWMHSSAKLDYYGPATTVPRLSAATVAQAFVKSSAVSEMIRRRVVREEEERAANDISSAAKKKSRKETAGSSSGDAANACRISAAHVNVNTGALQFVSLPAATPSIPTLCVHGAPRQPCRSVDMFHRESKISEGVYGVVFRASPVNTPPSNNGTVLSLPPSTASLVTSVASSSTAMWERCQDAHRVEVRGNDHVALKQVKSDWLSTSQVGFPAFLLREIDFTGRLRHPNVVQTEEVVFQRDAEVCAPGVGSAPNALHVSAPTTASYGASIYGVMRCAWRDVKDYLRDPGMRQHPSQPGFRSPYLHLSRRNVHPDAVSSFVGRIKNLCKQMFEGLACLHEHRIQHRDLKLTNMLLTTEGQLQICDFGLARHWMRREHLTPTVVTLMYRAPELHFGVVDYDTSLDIWSAGCIMVELFLKMPLFRAMDEMEHLGRVCDVIGFPTDETFSGVYRADGVVRLLSIAAAARTSSSSSQVETSEEKQPPPPSTTSRLRDYVRHGGELHIPLNRCYRGAEVLASLPACMDLLERLLSWNPKCRPTAREVLAHPFFTSEAPAPCSNAELTTPMPFQCGPSADASSQLRCMAGTAGAPTPGGQTVSVLNAIEPPNGGGEASAAVAAGTSDVDRHVGATDDGIAAGDVRNVVEGGGEVEPNDGNDEEEEIMVTWTEAQDERAAAGDQNLHAGAMQDNDDHDGFQFEESEEGRRRALMSMARAEEGSSQIGQINATTDKDESREQTPLPQSL